MDFCGDRPDCVGLPTWRQIGQGVGHEFLILREKRPAKLISRVGEKPFGGSISQVSKKLRLQTPSGVSRKNS